MHILLSPWFWTFVLASHLLRFVRIGIAPSLLFGLLNLGAIYVLAGRGAAILLAGLALAIWAGYRGDRRSRARTVTLAAIVLLAGLFLFHKLMMEHRIPSSAVFVVMSALGFSYVFLRAWDLIAALNTGRVPVLDPVSLAGYLAPFHMLPAGPITPYPQYAAMNRAAPEPPSFDATLLALNQIATGFFYKLVIAQGIRIFAFGVDGELASRTWMDSALLVVYVFFDFAGYSHVARAIGTLNGVPTPINFAAPFRSMTVTEFWTRWHVSLGEFVRRNVYLPLQMRGVRRTGVRWSHLVTAATLIVAFGFVGAWHRLTGTFILWGVGMGLIVTLEKYVRDYTWARWPWTRSAGAAHAMAIVGPVYVFVVITTSLHLVMSELLRA